MECSESHPVVADVSLSLRDRQLRALFERALDAMVIANDEGQYVDANPAACELFGLSRDELLGRKIADFAEPGFDFAATWEAFQRDEQVRVEFRLMRPDGTSRDVECAATANFVPHLHLCILRDVTERKQTEAQLQFNEARYRSAEQELQQLNHELEQRVEERTAELHRALDYLAFHVDNSPFAFIGCDHEFRFQFWSQRAEEIFGWKAAEVLGQDWRELNLVHLEDQTAVDQVATRLRNGETQVVHSNRNYCKDGTLIYCEWYTSSQVDEAGNIISVLSLVHDVSDRKRAEVERDRAEAALRQREIILREAQRVAHVGSWEFDLVTQKITWSEQMFHIFGLDPSQPEPSFPDYLQMLYPDDAEILQRLVDRAIHHGVPYEIEHRIIRPNGVIRYIVGRGEAVLNAAGEVIKLFGAGIDITERKLVEEQLRQSEATLAAAQRVAHIGNWAMDIQTQKISWSEEVFHLFGFDPTQPEPSYEEHLQKIHPDDRPLIQAAVEYMTTTGDSFSLDFRIVKLDGSIRYVEGRGEVSLDSQGKIVRLFGTLLDITDRKQLEAELRSQAEREQLLRGITQQIHRSLDLEQILTTTVTEVRQVLHADRVLIFRFKPDWTGVVAVESVTPPWTATLGITVEDSCFVKKYVAPYRMGHIQVIEDVCQARLSSRHLNFLTSIQVRANLIVPVLQRNEESTSAQEPTTPILWGLLIAHQCSAPRQWQATEIDLMKQLATQAGIAIQQAEFHRQVQRFNAELERQVRARTAELQLASDLESTLKRITDRVRDSLDENQILQSAVEELAKGLGVSCCNAALFNLDQGTSTICYEYTTGSVSPSQGRVSQIADFPEIYHQLLQGQYFQFCSLLPNAARGQVSMLCCPILDDQGVLGDLWLINQSYGAFSEQDIRLVQQVANQCAIALRQSSLYQTAQAQVQELERLNQLKDDFLSTVSHELRTPMSSIKMAIQMLETVLFREAAPSLPKSDGKSANKISISPASAQKLTRYFQILRDECHREISLINDLLDLTRLDAGTESLSPCPINLVRWLPPIAQSFVERAHEQQQRLTSEIPTDLPPLITDPSYLERIVVELLNNACKYTPAGEAIAVTVNQISVDERNPGSHGNLQLPLTCTYIAIQVSNSGVEIPPHEQEHIFDKFYRIPNNDPWKHGGTGLGLALVKKLSERLGGSIRVESQAKKTQFIVQIPLTADSLKMAGHNRESP